MSAPICTPAIRPAAAKPSPAEVNIYVDVGGRNEFVAKINRALICKHSKVVTDVLEANPASQDVVLKAAPKGAVHHVLEFIKKGKQPLRIGVSHEEFPRAIAILQANNALDVQPEQPQIENHIIWKITQFTITAEMVRTIQRASASLGTGGRVYRAMIQAVAYNVLHNGFTADQKAAIKNVAKEFPTLDQAIQHKVDDLKQRARNHEEMLQEKAARKESQARRQREYYG